MLCTSYINSYVCVPPGSHQNRRLLNWKGRQTVISMVRIVGLCTDGVSRRTQNLVTKVMCKCWHDISVIIKIVIISLIICLLFLMFMKMIGEGSGSLFNKSHSIPEELTILPYLPSNQRMCSIILITTSIKAEDSFLISFLGGSWFSTGFLWSFFLSSCYFT